MSYLSRTSLRFELFDETRISQTPLSVPFLKKDLSYFSPRHKPNASIIIDFPAPVSPVNIFKPLLIVSIDS